MAKTITPIKFPSTPAGIEIAFWHHVNDWEEIYPYLKWTYHATDSEGRAIHHSLPMLLCTNQGLVYSTFFKKVETQDSSDPDYQCFHCNYIPTNQSISYWAYLPLPPLAQELTNCKSYIEYVKPTVTFSPTSVISYVSRLQPLTSSAWTAKYLIAWNMLLMNEKVVRYLKETSDGDFKEFNKYRVHSIMGILKNHGVFEDSITRDEINMTLEQIGKPNKYCSYISKWAGSAKIKDEIESIISSVSKLR